jgi:lysophospholipid acyltransferase (LPLAT)-like uncharacterized protein
MRVMTDRGESMLNRTAGLLLATGIQQWMRTLDYKVIYHDPNTDPAQSRPCEQRFIYVFWHEYILVPLYLRGHCDLCMLLSPHRDGNVLERVARHLGFGVVRGSSYSRRVSGLKQLIHAGNNRHLCLTPDGPRGPRRQLSPGAVYLASRLQVPLVCLGFGVDLPWRLSSWDRFAIPRPFSRVRCVIAEPVSIPAELDSQQREDWRSRVEQILNRVTDGAERWAESHSSLPAQLAVQREPRRVTPCWSPVAARKGYRSRSAERMRT